MDRPQIPKKGSLELDLASRDDIGPAAEIYVRSFPRRVARLFPEVSQAQAFYRDFMELQWLAHRHSWFVARSEGRLAGFLILTAPETSLFRALFREGFAFRAALHALLGRYGYAPLGRIVKLVLAGEQKAPGVPPGCPHVSVVAVREGHTGEGIGSALLDMARASCGTACDRMWLNVESDNSGAIRLYERIGFRVVGSSAAELQMLWEFRAATAGAAK